MGEINLEDETAAGGSTNFRPMTSMSIQALKPYELTKSYKHAADSIHDNISKSRVNFSSYK
jgi:hypothetical protein